MVSDTEVREEREGRIGEGHSLHDVQSTVLCCWVQTSQKLKSKCDHYKITATLYDRMLYTQSLPNNFEFSRFCNECYCRPKSLRHLTTWNLVIG